MKHGYTGMRAVVRVVYHSAAVAAKLAASEAATSLEVLWTIEA